MLADERLYKAQTISTMSYLKSRSDLNDSNNGHYLEIIASETGIL